VYIIVDAEDDDDDDDVDSVDILYNILVCALWCVDVVFSK